MLSFFKKFFIQEKSYNQSEKIQNMRVKKKELEDRWNNLLDIEEELMQMNKKD